MTWQPIETAPKDQLIMLWRPDAYEWARCDIGVLDADIYAKNPKPYWRSRLYDVLKSEMRNWRPTHWQPLPQPPTQPTTDPC